MKEKKKCYGKCLKQCFCDCLICQNCNIYIYDCKCLCLKEKEHEYECDCNPTIYTKLCTCGHRQHFGHHKIKDCEEKCVPLLCPNNKYHPIEFKDEKFPEWFLNCHGGNCNRCEYVMKKNDKF